MKRYRMQFCSAFIALVLALCLTAGAQAATVGTDAGTPIDNTATLSYAIGGVGQPDIDSTTASFVVDNLVDLTMTGTSTGGVYGTNQAVLFTIQNDGNENQTYSVRWYAETTTDQRDMTITGLFLDNGTTPGVWDAGDTLIQNNPVSGTPYMIGVDVAADATVDILLVGTAPAGVTTGDTAVYTLVANTYNASSAVETAESGAADVPGSIDIVLADGIAPAGVDTAPVDVARNGEYNATATFTLVGTGISVSKASLVIYDPINGNSNPKAIPGALVRYTITVSNAGGSPPATLATITDTLQAELAHDPDLLQNDGTTPENAADDGFKVTQISGRTLAATQYFSTSGADAVDIAGADITADFTLALPAEAGYAAGELKGGESVSLVFNAVIQ